MGQQKREGVPTASPGASSSGVHVIDFIITEDVANPWHYHWSTLSEDELSLCGSKTMPANLDPTVWGASYTKVEVHWCPKCQEMKQQILPDDEAPTIPAPPRGGSTLPDD